jgi:hypothetical protein
MAGLLAASCPVSGTSAELAEHAEEEFRQGVELRHAADRARPHFEVAAACFEEVRRRGAHNAVLYRNLGNAHLLAGAVPQAILAYRRGLHLAPRDPDLLRGLGEAREHVAYPRSSTFAHPPADVGVPWLPALHSLWLFALAAALYAAAWLGLTRWRMTRRPRVLVMSAGGFVAALAVTLVLLLMARQEGERAAHPLVVIAEDRVPLRKGNSLAFPPRYDTPLPRGAEARLLFERDGWLQIELSGGEVGWVPRASALVDEG